MNELNLTSLKRLKDCKGKWRDFVSEEEITELTISGICPHYVFTNPATNETEYLYTSGELNNFVRNYIQRRRIDFTQKYEFLYFDKEKHKASWEDAVPDELSTIEDLYKIDEGLFGLPSGIYFLCKDKEIVYIGQSVNVLSRVATHRVQREKDFNKIFFIPCHISQLDDIERALIRQYDPKYNGTFSAAKMTDEDRQIVRKFIDSKMKQNITVRKN